MIRTDLKKIRKTLKLTQKQLASTFGVPQSFISQIENGIDAMPAHWTPKLINMLGISDLSEYQLATTYKNQSEDIIDRLRVFFESTGLPQGRIAMQCGLTAKMLNNILRGEGKMDVSVFLGLINGFNNLNLIWLLTGNGAMLRSENKEMERINTLLDTIATLQEAINAKTETINALNDKIKQLETNISK